MNAGELDRLVKLQKYTASQDTYGEETKTWSDIATVWAKKKDLKGTERWLANQNIAKVTCIYVTRYRSDVTPLCRLIDADGRTYNITAAVEVGRKEGLWLYVEARADTTVENPPTVPEPPPEEPPPEPEG